MQSNPVIALLAYVGVLVQLVGALLLVGLFALLRRYVLRRGYFRAWAIAWEAMAVALAAVVLRYHLGQPETLAALPWAAAAALPLRGVYIYAKLLMLAYLVAGAVMYATGRRHDRELRWVAVVLVAYAAIAAPIAAISSQASALTQAPILVAGLLFGTLVLLRLPRSRRTLGNRGVMVGFLVMAGLWCVYPAAFAARHEGSWALVLEAVATYGSFLDLVGQMILGYAMVVCLMEDAKREVDDAKAELRVAHDQLRRDALYDPLTGALNRRAFVEGVGLDLARGTYGAVALLDLDNLKEVNDEHGHATGDALLGRLVEELRAGLRASDKLYRWGGDEFLIIVPQARAVEVQARVAEILQDTAPLSVGGGRTAIRLEVSAGAIDYSSGEGLEAAIADADIAMYREKHRRKLARLTPPTATASTT